MEYTAKVRSEICPHLTSLKIIFQIGVVGKNVPAAYVILFSFVI